MFFHIKELQYHAKPEKPDPLFAKKLQEILGGQFGEISVALQYLFKAGVSEETASTKIC